MHTRNSIYNALILREKCPPLFHCNRIGYSTCDGATEPAAHRQLLCRRVLLFFAFSVLLTLILSSCTRDTDHSGYEPFEPHPTWTDSNPDAFWEK